MSKMIIQFEPKRILLSCPSQWWLGYKQEDEVNFHWMSVTYDKLKLFIQKYGYETNDILELRKFGIDTTYIKHNRNL
jgi:hypothetical protein